MNWGVSNFSSSVDHIAFVLAALSTALTLAVIGAMIYFCIKYRRGTQADRSNPKTQSTPLETAVSALLLFFGLGIFVWASAVYYHMYTPPKNAREIYVIAKQWEWTFQDAKNGDQINTLKVPVNTPIRLIMTSQDVIHSFFVPDFRLKQDLLPGRYTSLWFTAYKTGRFQILCAEYCGLDHSRMRGEIEVVPQNELTDFAAPGGGPAAEEAAKGRTLFSEKGCIACHSGAHPIGPALEHLYGKTVQLEGGQTVTADDNYIRNSILDPQGQIVKGFPRVMPTFQGQLSESELAALIAYIKGNNQ
jgi:cytochrome c oxidase subunit 2